MWDKMEHDIRKVTKEALGESSGFRLRNKKYWWRNESVHGKVRIQMKCFKAWSKCKIPKLGKSIRKIRMRPRMQ